MQGRPPQPHKQAKAKPCTALTRLLFFSGILRLWSWRTLEATICLICKKQKRSPPKPLRPAENTRGKAPHFLVRPWKAEEVPSSVFDTLTSARHSSATPRCWWRRGGRVAKRDGGWAPSPQRKASGRGDCSPFREGPSALARTTSPHPPRRSPSSVPALIMSSTSLLHTNTPLAANAPAGRVH